MAWGMLVAWLFLIAAMVTGAIWHSRHSRANNRSALDARAACCFHIKRHSPGTSENERWARRV